MPSPPSPLRPCVRSVLLGKQLRWPICHAHSGARASEREVRRRRVPRSAYHNLVRVTATTYSRSTIPSNREIRMQNEEGETAVELRQINCGFCGRLVAHTSFCHKAKPSRRHGSAGCSRCAGASYAKPIGVTDGRREGEETRPLIGGRSNNPFSCEFKANVRGFYQNTN